MNYTVDERFAEDIMNTKTLTQFLHAANKATYANKDAPQATSLRPKSEDYHFEKDDLIYHDTYFGGRDFIGEEIVYEHGMPVWGTNYYGFISDIKVSEVDVYDFLRQALMEKYDDIIPVRGPRSFSDDQKIYRFSVDGDLAHFSGTEEILFDGKAVYRCFVHGGYIR